MMTKEEDNRFVMSTTTFALLIGDIVRLQAVLAKLGYENGVCDACQGEPVGIENGQEVTCAWCDGTGYRTRRR